MNIMELFADSVKPFLDGEKPPLNVAEVMNLWFYLTATEQSLVGERVALNTVQDPDLREKLHDVIHNVHGPMCKEVREFLKSEGVPMEPPSPAKPIGDFRNIPEGSKLNDEEVANLTSFNLVLGIQYACRGMTEAVRPDVAAMFARFQMKKAAFTITYRELLRKKGWLKIPPAYPSKMPVQ